MFFTVLDQRTTNAGSTLEQGFFFQLQLFSACYLILHEVVCYTARQ